MKAIRGQSIAACLAIFICCVLAKRFSAKMDLLQRLYGIRSRISIVLTDGGFIAVLSNHLIASLQIAVGDLGSMQSATQEAFCVREQLTSKRKYLYIETSEADFASSYRLSQRFDWLTSPFARYKLELAILSRYQLFSQRTGAILAIK